MLLLQSKTMDKKSRNCRTLTFSFGLYQGEVHPDDADLRHGFGSCTYSNTGAVYSGEWRNGAAHGHGEKTFGNGDVFDGAWLSGKRHGVGTYSYAAGHKYEGEYANDVCHGFGKQTMINGDFYEGEWRQGKKHGKGTEQQGRRKFIATWRSGIKHGVGELHENGVVLRGTWDCGVFEESEESKQRRAAQAERGALQTSGDLSRPISDDALTQLQSHGLDPQTAMALQLFNENVSRSMNVLGGGLGKMESHLTDLSYALKDVSEVLDGQRMFDEEEEEEELPE